MVNDLGKGRTCRLDHYTTSDEIGEMVVAVNSLSEKLTGNQFVCPRNRKKEFRYAPFYPLSGEDTLGKALIAMRDNLKTSERELLSAAWNLKKKDQLLQAVAEATHDAHR